MSSDLESIIVTKLKTVDIDGGNVLHFIKKSDESYLDFGEAYFSLVDNKRIKAWKKHKEMVMNLAVPYGEVKFIFFDNKLLNFREEIIGYKNYSRITVPSNIWFGFQGMADPHSLIINFANIEHNDNEVERMNLNNISYDW